MPSEKRRYLRDLSPSSPLDDAAFREGLAALHAEQLARLVWRHAESDDILKRAATASIVIRSPESDFETMKSAIDYALHFPKLVRYTERGHGVILDEILSALQDRVARGQGMSIARIAHYVIIRAQTVEENFENSWDWTSSLEHLSKWISETFGGLLETTSQPGAITND